MYIQDCFVKYYDYRPFQNEWLNKIIGNISKIPSYFASLILPWWFRHSSACNDYLGREKEKIVVSLTSFPERIDTVWLVLECIFRQTCVPEHIIVWLSKKQFLDTVSLPSMLRRYPKNAVKFRFVDDDLRSHKKYWYAIQEFKELPLITIDDDIIYDSHMIEDLLSAAKQYPTSVACCFGNRMSWDTTSGQILPYSEWKGGQPAIMIIDNALFFGSGGGTYFPVGSLQGADEPAEILKEICPTADDIWLNAIIRINGYKCVKIREHRGVPEWHIAHNKTLSSINNGMKANDRQLMAVQQWCINNKKINPFNLA